MIVGYHVAFVSGGLGPDGAGPWLAGLNLGVPLFFAISGFLLYRPWVAARLAGTTPPSLRVYGLRRALRIVPAYWVALVLIVARARAATACSTGRARSSTSASCRPTTPRASRAGSGRRGRSRSRSRSTPRCRCSRSRRGGCAARCCAASWLLIGGLVAVSVAWRAVCWPTVDPADPAYFPLLVALPAQLDVFAGGMALAVLSAAGREWRGAAAGWLVAAAAYAALALLRPDGIGARGSGEHELQAVAAIGLLAPAVLPAPAARCGACWRGGRWPGSACLLRRLPVAPRRAARAGRARPAVPVLAVAGLALSLALGAASWYGLERHALRLGRRAAGARRASRTRRGRSRRRRRRRGDERAERRRRRCAARRSRRRCCSPRRRWSGSRAAATSPSERLWAALGALVLAAVAAVVAPRALPRALPGRRRGRRARGAARLDAALARLGAAAGPAIADAQRLTLYLAIARRGGRAAARPRAPARRSPRSRPARSPCSLYGLSERLLPGRDRPRRLALRARAPRAAADLLERDGRARGDGARAARAARRRPGRGRARCGARRRRSPRRRAPRSCSRSRAARSRRR